MEKFQLMMMPLIVNGKRVQLLNNRDPKSLPWNELDIDIVIEATGNLIPMIKPAFI